MTDRLRAAAEAALTAMDKATHYMSDKEYRQLNETIEQLRAALAEPEVQSTHSAECYKWHHKCAIAEVERLKLFCEEMLSELYVYRASKYLKDVTAAIRARGEK